jgi:hypothetical protein
MGLPAYAREGGTLPAAAVVAQADGWMWGQNVNQGEWDAYISSDYDYYDAAVLADFWDATIEQAKARIGRKLKWGISDQAVLDQMLVDARVQALKSVEDLNMFSASGYSYDDAQALADFWGDQSAYDAKLRIERNLIMGNYNVVSQALKLATRR